MEASSWDWLLQRNRFSSGIALGQLLVHRALARAPLAGHRGASYSKRRVHAVSLIVQLGSGLTVLAPAPSRERVPQVQWRSKSASPKSASAQAV